MRFIQPPKSENFDKFYFCSFPAKKEKHIYGGFIAVYVALSSVVLSQDNFYFDYTSLRNKSLPIILYIMIGRISLDRFCLCSFYLASFLLPKYFQCPPLEDTLIWPCVLWLYAFMSWSWGINTASGRIIPKSQSYSGMVART